MTTYGRVCLWLTVLGLGACAWFAGDVHSKHNDVSQRLRNAEEKTAKAQESQRTQSNNLKDAQSRLARLQIGWDKSWVIVPSANTGVIIQGSRLGVSGLGTQTGLEMLEDKDGQPSSPSIHAFKVMPENGIYYVGEFRASQIDATSTILEPTWVVGQQEAQSWLASAELPWRFRTMTPAAPRMRVDQLNAQIQTLRERWTEIQGNIAREETLLQQAEGQLTIRKQELLGSPGADPTPGRPEYSAGLLKAIRAEEDRRNDLQYQIDQLRRGIKVASDARDALLHQLNEYLERLPSSDESQVTRSNEDVR